MAVGIFGILIGGLITTTNVPPNVIWLNGYRADNLSRLLVKVALAHT